jgi:hypothetical protein
MQNIKLSKPAVIHIYDSQTLAFLYHFFNHSELVLSGGYVSTDDFGKVVNTTTLKELAHDIHYKCLNSGPFDEVCAAMKEESINRFGEKTRKPIEVVLNSQHTASVNESQVQVGCQSFSFDVIEKLYQAVTSMKRGDIKA